MQSNILKYKGKVTVTDRERAEVEEVDGIISLDEDMVCLGCGDVRMIIEGEELTVEELNNSTHKVVIRGRINSFYYTDGKIKSKRKGFFS